MGKHWESKGTEELENARWVQSSKTLSIHRNLDILREHMAMNMQTRIG